MAIGSRSQSARTYLEKHFDVFSSCSLEELIAHGLRALRDTLPNEVELTVKVNIEFACDLISNFKNESYIKLEPISSPSSAVSHLQAQYFMRKMNAVVQNFVT